MQILLVPVFIVAMWRLAYSPSPVHLSAKRTDSQLTAPPGRDSITLSSGEFVVGRGVNANIVICKDNTLSRKHATLRLVDVGFKAKEQNSPHFAFEIHDGVYVKKTNSWKPLLELLMTDQIIKKNSFYRDTLY